MINQLPSPGNTCFKFSCLFIKCFHFRFQRASFSRANEIFLKLELTKRKSFLNLKHPLWSCQVGKTRKNSNLPIKLLESLLRQLEKIKLPTRQRSVRKIIAQKTGELGKRFLRKNKRKLGLYKRTNEKRWRVTKLLETYIVC